MSINPNNRELWLTRGVEALRPYLGRTDSPLPKVVKVSCGWPSRGGLSKTKRIVGEAFGTSRSANGSHETFVSPFVSNAEDVLCVLLRELCQHCVGVDRLKAEDESLRKIARAEYDSLTKRMGFVGPRGALVPNDSLRHLLRTIAGELGPYPHASLDGYERVEKAGTRLIKYSCPSCGFIGRSSLENITKSGPPKVCGCGQGPMVVDPQSVQKRQKRVEMVDLTPIVAAANPIAEEGKRKALREQKPAETTPLSAS